VKPEEPGSDALLERAAKRVSDNETFVASAFRAWCGAQLDLEAVATRLACTRLAAVHVALCRRPRSETFRADVAAIAAASGVDEGRLGGLLREIASLAAFRRGGGQQILAAARDAPNDSKEPKS
jgi:hypothetical protein